MQELLAKLEILANAAKYDVSCASSGKRHAGGGGPGGRRLSGVCHSWSADGRCISLLKLLYSNVCRYDCRYCANRRSNDLRRVSLTPREVADLTTSFYRRNYIEGLFLSTGVFADPDSVMEELIATLHLLRGEYGFRGYIHLKLVPGVDPLLVEKAGRYADRLSINLEVPRAERLALLAPDKNRAAILEPMRQASGLIAAAKEERRRSIRAPTYAPAGQSTQVMVGATDDSDRTILQLSEQLYRQLQLRRVYYSAYIPVNQDAGLPVLSEPPLLREHRLYQADWLLRFYGFEAAELLDAATPHFDLALDPKACWALRHPERFPLEVNRAEYLELLRVPGVGPRSARRIVRARRAAALHGDDLQRLGVVMKRARWFLTARGRYLGPGAWRTERVRRHLVVPGRDQAPGTFPEQLALFPSAMERPEDLRMKPGARL